jgi:hypothetical protein
MLLSSTYRAAPHHGRRAVFTNRLFRVSNFNAATLAMPSGTASGGIKMGLSIGWMTIATVLAFSFVTAMILGML